jgi:hypothetical protein
MEFTNKNCKKSVPDQKTPELLGFWDPLALVEITVSGVLS